MLKLFKKSKIFIFFIISINISSLIASEAIPILSSPNQVSFPNQAQSSFANKGDIIKQLYNENGLLIYDKIITLIEEIDEGYLDDICTEEDWYKINNFIIFLANEGILPDATEDEKADLEQDVQDLLEEPYENDISFENAFYKIDDYQIIPAVFHYGQNDMVLCKSWFKKRFKRLKKFIKKHKKAIIIGTVLVVASVAVLATVAVASSKSKKKKKSPKSKNNKYFSNSTQSSNNYSSNEPELSMQDLNDQVSNCKDTIIENDLLISDPINQDYLSSDNERIIGSSLAHNALNDIHKNTYNNQEEDLFIKGHGKIDNVFSTEHTSFYLDNNTSNNTSNSFKENLFYQQGQQALNAQYYDKAINSFGRAIEINPQNHNIYLDRAFAYLNKEEFDQSLNDYYQYRENEQKNYPSKGLGVLKDSAKIFCGFRNGINKGLIVSGKQLISSASNVIEHPVDTVVSIYKVIEAIERFNMKCTLHPIETSKEVYKKIADSKTWIGLRDVVIPEFKDVIENWENLSVDDKAESVGFLISKGSADLFLPGVAAKTISAGVKGAKELALIAKNLRKTEKVIVLEALAETGGGAGTFKEFIHSSKVFESATSAGNLIEGFSVDIFAKAGKVVDRAGLTKAGRALAKHGGRKGSVFPKTKGNPVQINKQAQQILEDILNHPNKEITDLGIKGYKIYEPSGKGVRFKKDKTLIGFIEKQYE